MLQCNENGGRIAPGAAAARRPKIETGPTARDAPWPLLRLQPAGLFGAAEQIAEH
jgi:hypothetical protein